MKNTKKSCNNLVYTKEAYYLLREEEEKGNDNYVASKILTSPFTTDHIEMAYLDWSLVGVAYYTSVEQETCIISTKEILGKLIRVPGKIIVEHPRQWLLNNIK
jgi:hypothetical protein